MNVNSLSRVNVIGKIDGYVEAMLNKTHKDINTVASYLDRDVKLAQKDSRIFVNSGMITSSFDYKEMRIASEFKKNIINNLIANQKASENDLRSGFSALG